jgi:hypothetical protein
VAVNELEVPVETTPEHQFPKTLAKGFYGKPTLIRVMNVVTTPDLAITQVVA